MKMLLYILMTVVILVVVAAAIYGVLLLAYGAYQMPIK